MLAIIKAAQKAQPVFSTFISYMSPRFLRFNFVLDLSECPDNLCLNCLQFEVSCLKTRFVPQLP
jgi:hypothetical protein